jgi:hypothetical protein
LFYLYRTVQSIIPLMAKFLRHMFCPAFAYTYYIRNSAVVAKAIRLIS